MSLNTIDGTSLARAEVSIDRSRYRLLKSGRLHRVGEVIRISACSQFHNSTRT
jgi:hypothetical protein